MYALLQPITLAMNDMLMLGVVFFLLIYLNLKLSQENSYCIVISILINEKTEI